MQKKNLRGNKNDSTFKENLKERTFFLNENLHHMQGGSVDYQLRSNDVNGCDDSC
jgi:hypothetical protein